MTENFSELKNNFYESMEEWFNKNWTRNFQFKSDVEVLQKLEFDKMRALYELRKLINKEEVEEFNNSLLEKIKMFRTQLLYQNITYYTLRFTKIKLFKNQGLEVFYVKVSDNLFDVYEKSIKNTKSQKWQMDEQTLKRYLAQKNTDELLIMMKKSS